MVELYKSQTFSLNLIIENMNYELHNKYRSAPQRRMGKYSNLK